MSTLKVDTVESFTNASSVKVYRNATIGNLTSPTITNAGLQIQDSSTSMYIDGNSIVTTATTYISTNGAYSLELGTNDIARLSISSAGTVSIPGDLTVDTTTFHVDSAADRVGIGTVDPATALHVNGNITYDNTITTQTAESGVFQINGNQWMRLNYSAGGDRPAGSDQGNMVAFTKGVKISRGSASWYYDNTHALQVRNDGDAADRKGISIFCGSDDDGSGWGTGTAMSFYDGDASLVGTITFAGGTVSYNAFTGGHPARVNDPGLIPYSQEDRDPLPPIITAYEPGTVVKILSVEKDNFAPIYTVVRTTSAADKTAMGVYHYGTINEEEPDMHSIASVGDGAILVCNEGGDIETGDYLCSSNTAGHAMKQSDDLLHNYTVAKATQPVTWESEKTQTKVITCTIHSA